MKSSLRRGRELVDLGYVGLAAGMYVVVLAVLVPEVERLPVGALQALGWCAVAAAAAAVLWLMGWSGWHLWKAGSRAPG